MNSWLSETPSFDAQRLSTSRLASQLDDRGFAVFPSVLSPESCLRLTALYDEPSFRKTVVMSRHRFGQGEYKYWDYPLPPEVQGLRETLFPVLVPLANKWMAHLQLPRRFPDTLEAMRAKCEAHNQRYPTPLLLRYEQGGYNTLHQDLYGEVFFPFQAAIFLSQPETDYTGGEFVLTEQIPRAQSKVTVLRPERGDLVVFAARFRPKMGRRGYYRCAMKHGVSEVTSGQRNVLGIIFHDAEY